MIIEKIISNRNNFFWTIFHALLGAICTLSPVPLILWFYFLLVTNLFKSFGLLINNNIYFFLALFSYIISFELLDRMSVTSPYIPYELSKYLLVIIGFTGILLRGVRYQNGLIMSLFLTPAIFYDFSGVRKIEDVVTTYLAPVSIGLCLSFMNKSALSFDKFNQLLKLVWLTSLSSLIFTIIKTPDLDRIEFELGANFETTAGHSSNQVSTVLGLGLFLTFYSIFHRLRFSGNRVLDWSIFVGFLFQGLLSFSRGGIVVAVFCIVIIVFLDGKNSVRHIHRIKSNLFFTLCLIFLFGYGVFSYADKLTGGQLSLRYQGETQGTLAGSKTKTADQIVTGRFSILEDDINLWLKHLAFGVGCGSSKYLRNSERVLPAHIEFSRLLAEHGLFGFVYIIMICLIPYNIYMNKSPGRMILFAIAIFAILTSFHAAMRTFVTPLLLIFATIVITEDAILKKRSVRQFN